MKMTENEWLEDRFEARRTHLRGVAYRMLGSLSEADDAVQEAWIKVSRAGTEDVENLNGWLTTVVARVCLDMLRLRKSKREEPLDLQAVDPIASGSTDPENEAVLAESVGLALLVVLETLAPAERISFVLHDLFAVSFDEIGAIVGRSPAAARQLASRARRRVQGSAPASSADLNRQRVVVEAFLTALRGGDFDGLIAVLDPDVVVRIDAAASGDIPREIHGATNWARGAIAFSRFAPFTQVALVDGAVGLILAVRGRLLRALRLSIRKGRIAEVDIVADRERLQKLDLGVLN
jgi:RNA polymerase sigma-70 factor (ECF subfamily)